MAIDLNLKYSEAQDQLLFNTSAKYVVHTKGRRFGGTQGMAQACIEWALDGISPILWGDTINGNIDRYYDRYFLPVLKQLPDGSYNFTRQKKELRIFSSIIDFRSADRPENWEGFGYKKILLNEAGIILKNTYLYDNAVLPMMIDFEDSQLYASGVPKGKKTKSGNHRFYDLYLRAVEGHPDYALLQHTSYDNPFIHKDNIKEIEDTLDYHTAQQEIYGQFTDNVGRPFAYAFDVNKHVKQGLKYEPKLPLILSFDFNVDPITCIVAQHNRYINILQEYRLNNSDIYELCNHIRSDHPQAYFRITGDASGQNRSALTRGNMNYYHIIKNELSLNDAQIILPTFNPSISNSRMLTNSILAKHPDFNIDSSCHYLIEDLNYVEVTESGDIDKAKDKHKGHLLDGFRYYLYTFHHNFISLQQ